MKYLFFAISVFFFGAISLNPSVAGETNQSESSSKTIKVKSITYIPGSTKKIEQLIGDYDKSIKAATGNKTETKYGIIGSDLGYSFEHEGKVIILFGDTKATVGPGGDCIAYSDTKDPEGGFRLKFFVYKQGKYKGHYVRIRPNGISMRGFEVPVCGISLDKKIYVMCKTEATRDPDTFRSLHTERSVLTRFDPKSGSFRYIREISRLPEGKFIEISAHVDPNPMPGLPSKEHNILLWGSGKHRISNCYLAVIPQSQFETGKQMKYFTGLDEDGSPNWSSSEKDAKPVVEHPTIGDISVTWCSDLQLWIMTYDSRIPDRGIVFRYSATPWGPWSEKQIIFDARRDKGFGYFIHDIHSEKDDGLAGPVIGRGKDNPKKVGGGHYAPYVIERFTKFNNGTLTIYYVLSTWNPYVVVLMKSQFKVEINNE